MRLVPASEVESRPKVVTRDDEEVSRWVSDERLAEREPQAENHRLHARLLARGELQAAKNFERSGWDRSTIPAYFLTGVTICELCHCDTDGESVCRDCGNAFNVDGHEW